MKRRALLIAAACAPLSAFAQSTGRTLRVALVAEGSEAARRPYIQALLKRLQELGYSQGRNLVFDARYAGVATERLGALATEVVATKPDIIVTPSTPSSLAAQQATSAIPIVFIGPADPVGAGLIASLSRPGGNLTGVSGIYTDIASKWLQIMREVSPGAKRIAYLSDGTSKGSAQTFERLQELGRPIRLAVVFLDGRTRQGLEKSLESAEREGLNGLIVGAAFPLLEQRAEILAFAARRRMPIIYSRREYMEQGGLLFYGSDGAQLYVRGAEFVHRIAQGAKPAELPVERPNVVRMVVNLKTARTQGINIPQTVLVRADEVIE